MILQQRLLRGIMSEGTLMPLSMVAPGKKVRLVRINGGRNLRSRLAAMGLMPGIDVEVISGGHGGPCVISVRDSRLILGRGMALKIEVE